VTVDEEGVLTPVAAGATTVTVGHKGVTAFTAVEVDAGGAPPAAQDVSPSLDVRTTGLRPDRNTGFFVQRLELTNHDTVPIPGPVLAVVSGIPAELFLVNNDGVTENVAPVGSPFFRSPLTNGITMDPGEAQALTLNFLNPDRVPITWDLATVRTSDP
jgi:hypothetical protein